ncbi:MAG: L-serine ammonia-lyase, iron-sulfur-dependent, subunit alpha [Peptococcaceae bacterium]|nr:L-serine ammonia-lyase, iron-sulfur-dependent, subunit alpha [Peptococcaceae bacterium]MDH7526177.1 L-serine ammonia-lyase, iron-sulfur-dependent, subunit alpha [Peptococcaceae bacterium]
MQESQLITLLKQEVKPGLGCTEPAAVALAAAHAALFLGGKIEKADIIVSSNIYKNAYAVTIPNTQEKGLKIASALGLLLRNPQKELEIFEDVKPEDVVKAKHLISNEKIQVTVQQLDDFYIETRIEGEKGWAKVVLSGGHTDLVKAVVNNEVVFSKNDFQASKRPKEFDLTAYTIRGLVEFIEKIPLDEILFLENGIKMNLQISAKGLELKSGLAVGSGLQAMLKKGVLQNDLVNKARIAVAGACDARMAGLNMPVMTSMGSGNHGLEASIPLIIVGKEIRAPKEKVLRALALSHLVTAFVKQHTGKLSPICGCSVAAGAGATAGIAWLMGGSLIQVEGAIKNVIGNLSGLICDGAKGGCALKLATSAAESVIAAQLALNNIIIQDSDGIISTTVEDTIRNLGKISSSGMANIDSTILEIILNKGSKENAY